MCSMISEQVKELRTIADNLSFEVSKNLKEAADTIESLSAKLSAANMERSERYYGGGWIVCNDRLPEEDGFYIATLDGEIIGGDEPFSGMAEFENGKWVDDEEDYKCVLAWMQKPTPYHPKEGATNVEEKKTD